MDHIEITLIVLNLLLGLGLAAPLARRLQVHHGRSPTILPCLVMLVGMYFVECVALVMGMGIPVFSIALAGPWGFVAGLWFRRPNGDTRRMLLSCVYLSVYSSLPALSFIIVPLAAWAHGRQILSVAAATGFGIPEAFPWPANTILGFYAACAFGAVLLKTAISTTAVYWLTRRIGTQHGQTDRHPPSW